MNILRALTLAFLFLLIANIIPPIQAAAPNFYDCRWSQTSATNGRCVVNSSACVTNYEVPNPSQCAGKPQPNCAEAAYPCVNADDPTNSCFAQGGSLNVGGCPGGLPPLPCTDCAFGFVCCPDSNNPNNPGSVPIINGPPLSNCAGGKGIETAIGCIPIESENALALFFLRWGMGLGGGIALILMVVSTFMIMTSAGDPRKLQAGKELLTSAITGLVMLVFSAYILNFIGVKILDIF